jgi:hypothetical protein
LRIRSDYFAANYGVNHPFHFLSSGPPYVVRYGDEWYWQVNGAYFGLMGPLPGTWNAALDDLYIDLGEDGNYYLYDRAQPDLAIQLTFVQAVGDDQIDSSGSASAAQ